MFDKVPFTVKVPEFEKEVEEELKNDHYFNELSPKDKEDRIRHMVQYRSLLWACRTSAAAYNFAVYLFIIMVLVSGRAMLEIVENFLKNQ
jgi:hypothetical protein